MALACRPLRPEARAAWDAFVAAHPEGTFFHLAAWADVIQRAFGHQPHYLMAERDGAVVGVLPLVHMRSRLFGSTLVSAPFCVYGGPVAADAESLAVLLEAAAALMARTRAESVELRFRDEPRGDWLDAAEWQRGPELYVTFRRAITASDEANLKAIPNRQRAVIRKAIDLGLTSRIGNEVDLLWRIYAESVHNLGTPVFPRRYFRLLAETFRDRTEILVVRKDDTPVAAVMSFFWRDEVNPYYGGGTEAARHCFANPFMYWEVMRLAAAKGVRLFDFGRSKIETGSFAFKKNLGFPPAPLHYRFRLPPGGTIPERNPLNPKYSRAIAAWKRLPLPVANLLGPFIVRGLG
ncbi:MAG: FemAB family PEP-CTERM system-associated protein [Rhodospirillales bacterium]|nr:FemAB family PEP-CTERM system-associated protein [Rhodospirillales bacterium]